MPCVESQHNTKYKNKLNGMVPSFGLFLSVLFFIWRKIRAGKDENQHDIMVLTVINTCCIQITNAICIFITLMNFLNFLYYRH